PSAGNGFLHFANTLIVLGSISYAGYRFLRSVVLPRFFDVPDPALEEQRQLQQQISDLQNSMKFVMDSVVQTLQTVNQQQEQLNALVLMNSNEGRGELQRLQSDISIVKSLLLNQNQFAAIPANVGARPNSCAVPAWQKVKNMSEGSATLSKELIIRREEAILFSIAPPKGSGGFFVMLDNAG
uniref:Peroxin-14 n=1 Tax=Parascaris equorum TaxID=6256 RepID=A0A914RTR2_PAREQ